MASERADRDKSNKQPSPTASSAHATRLRDQESILAALALLLGPETEYRVRLRTTRQLTRQGSEILPLLLTVLNAHPEINTPPWPWWPPQYEHLSRLLLQLSRSGQQPLRTLLESPGLTQPIGPVLWTSIIEAAGLLLQPEHEPLLAEGLTTPWATSRYAAAMALANLTAKIPLRTSTLETLRERLNKEEPIAVRLAAAYGLLRSEDDNGSGLEALIELLDRQTPEEARKAATFVLAAEPPIYLPPTQREHLAQLLVTTLEDACEETALHAARALGSLALPSTLPAICALLDYPYPQIQIAALATLEAMIERKSIRQALQQNVFSTQIVPLLRSPIPEVRQHASYALAAFGGDYAAAVLGTTLLNQEHPGQVEAIEGLRLLHGAMRIPTRTNVIRWLLRALSQPQEEIRVTALDSLSYLILQARTHGQRRALAEMSDAIVRDGVLSQLLGASSALVRQRSIELLSVLSKQPDDLRPRLEQLLQEDSDNGVRACVAATLGQIAARWALPALLQALLDPDEHVAETALNSIGRLTSPDDYIVVYILKELSAYGHAEEGNTNRLAQQADALLRKWRKKKV